MTVQDLIYALEKYDPNWVVVTTAEEEDYFTDVTTEQINVESLPRRQGRPQSYTTNVSGEEAVLIKGLG